MALTLKQMQGEIAELSAERGWDKQTITEEFLLFVEEVGELAKEIRKLEKMHLDIRKTHSSDLEGECADVLNYILGLANKLGVDLEEAYVRKREITRQRVWK